MSHSKHSRRRKGQAPRASAPGRLWFNMCAAVWLTGRMARFALGEMRRTRRA